MCIVSYSCYLWPFTDWYYQLDFLTPGIFPSFASSRKQMRHNPKSRIYPRLRPHRKHRLTRREENFGVFNDRTYVDVFAIQKTCPPTIPPISRFIHFVPVKTQKQKEKSGSKG